MKNDFDSRICLECPYCREEGYSHDPVLRNVYCCHPTTAKLIAPDIEYDFEVGEKPTWCPLSKDDIKRYYINSQEINEIFERVRSK